MSPIARRKRKTKRKLRLRNAVLLILIFGTFVTAVIGIRFMNLGVQLILPEAREARVIKIPDRENNAYYVMVEAVAMLDNRLGDLWIPDERMTEIRYETKSLSIGDMMRIRRPDDDPELLDYLKNAKLAVDHASTMEGKPYFLCDFPIIASYYYAAPELEAGRYLTTHLGYARAQIEQWNDTDGGLQSLGSLYSILKLIQTSLFDQGGYYGATYTVWHDYYKTLQHLYRKYPASEMRRLLRTLLESQPPPYEDMQRVLDANLSLLDAPMLYPDYMTTHGRTIDGSQRLRAFQLQFVANYLRENISTFRMIADLAPHEYEDNIRTPIWNHIFLEEHLGEYHNTSILYKLVSAAQINAYPIATKLSFDLEDYKSLHGKYPDTLDELVPDFIDAVPINPVSGEPFLYVLNGSAYNLVDPRMYLYNIGDYSEIMHSAMYVDGFAFKKQEEK